MVAKRQCSFCAREIEPGTGTIFVKRDGTVYQFCSSSCRKQQLHLGRIGHRFKWTRAYELKRAAERSSAQRTTAAAPPARTRARRPARTPPPVVPTGAVPVEAAPASPASAEEPPAPAKPVRAKRTTKSAPKASTAAPPPATDPSEPA